MADVALHPVVAALVATLVGRNGQLGFPADAVAAFRAAARSFDVAGRQEVVVHLLAWAKKAQRAGADDGLLAGVAVLVLELCGDVAAATDAFSKAGVDRGAALVGRAEALRAPTAPTPSSAPPVQARRGLTKKSP